MLFTTPTQYAVLALMLVVGWLFGFASHPGGKKWRTAYDEERAKHAAFRDEAGRHAKDNDGRVTTLKRENAALEARNTELSAARSSVGGVTAPVAAASAVPAFGTATAPETQKRGWFGSQHDDLTRIRGIDTDLAARLKTERVERFGDIASLTDQDEIALERRLGAPAGYIQREQWREQARLLTDGQNAEHAARFGGNA